MCCATMDIKHPVEGQQHTATPMRSLPRLKMILLSWGSSNHVHPRGRSWATKPLLLAKLQPSRASRERPREITGDSPRNQYLLVFNSFNSLSISLHRHYDYYGSTIFWLFQKPSQTGWCVHNFEPYPIVQNTQHSMPQWPDPLTAMPDNQLCISDLGSETIQVQVFNPSNFIPSQNIFRLELQGSTRKTCGQRASKWAKDRQRLKSMIPSGNLT